jgi:hypothetical protein
MLDSFVYQYSVETLIFGFGIYCGIRTKVLAPGTAQGRRRLILLITGFLLILVLQGLTLVWGK